jgi:hypothetical protein
VHSVVPQLRFDDSSLMIEFAAAGDCDLVVAGSPYWSTNPEFSRRCTVRRSDT